MISERTFQIVHFCFKYCSLINIIPFEWISSTQTLVPIQQSWKRKLYYTNITYSVGNSIVLGLQLYFSHFGQTETFGDYAILFLGFSTTANESFLQLFVLLTRHEFAFMVNVCYKVFLDFHKKFSSTKIPYKYHKEEIMLLLGVLGCILIPLTFSCLYIYKPLNRLFVASFYFLNKESSFLAFLIALLPTLWTFIIGWGLVMFLAVPGFWILLNILFILQEFRPTKSNLHPKDAARSPWKAYNAYRTFQIMSKLLNNLSRDPLLVIVDLAMTLVVISNVALIKYHHVVPVIGFFLFGGHTTFVTIILLSLYIKLGEYHESSKKFLKTLQKKAGECKSIQTRQLMTKHTKSCQPVKMYMGNVGYFTKKTSLRIIGKIVYYTSKCMLLLNNAQ